MAALVVGGIFGVQALSKRSDSDGECPAERCTAKGVELNDEAKTSAWIANVGIGLGLVGVVVGSFLVLTAPDKPAAAATRTTSLQPQVSAQGGGLWLRSTF